MNHEVSSRRLCSSVSTARALVFAILNTCRIGGGDELSEHHVQWSRVLLLLLLKWSPEPRHTRPYDHGQKQSERYLRGVLMCSNVVRIGVVVAVLYISILPHAFGQCLVVSPTGSGAGTGADWNNAIGAANLAAEVSRGNIYYLAAGTYGNQVFQTADSGSSTITIRAAISADHCTATGWSDSLAASSSSPVSFRDTTDAPNTFNGPLVVKTDYWTFDGNGGCVQNMTLPSGASPGNSISNCNMVVDASWPAPQLGLYAKGTSHISTKSVWFKSFGNDLVDADSQNISTISCSSNVATITLTGQRQHAYIYLGQWVMIAGVSPSGFNNSVSNAQYGVQISSVTSDTDWTQPFTVAGNGYTCPSGSGSGGTVKGPATVPDEMWNDVSQGATGLSSTDDYFTDSCSPFNFYLGSNVTIDHDIFWRSSSNVAEGFHCEVIADAGTTSLTFSNNLTLDYEGTGHLVVLGRTTNRTVSTASWSSGTATVTLAAGGPDYSTSPPNNYIGIEGVTPAGYNGVYQIINVSGNAISYSVVSNPGSYSHGGDTYVALDSDTWSIFGNVFGISLNNPYDKIGPNTGVVTCINMQRCSKFGVYNNTFVGGNATLSFAEWGFIAANNSLCTSNTFENNLAFATTQPSGTWSNSCASTEDYNSYLNLGSNAPPSGGAHDVMANSVADPFVSESDHNYLFNGQTSYVGGGLTLPSPYNIDPLGNVRGTDGSWDRGAFQFNGATPPNPPTTLTVTGVH